MEISQRFENIRGHINEGKITIMILGLGSVGTYLLDYLVSKNDETIRIIVVGRNAEKIQCNANIVRISALIRHVNKSQIIIESDVDLNSVEQIACCIEKHQPDFIINSSRVYSGLKYGSISWKYLRAYGIWTPLAIKYIKNIMEAAELVQSKAIIVNTSYSDVVIPWLRAAGKPYPDFGSGNINHLIPRIKYATAEYIGVEDFWNIGVELATAHFHDVVISKEGHTEGMRQLMKVFYKEQEVEFDQDYIFRMCKVPMPADEKRNMMNASSNYDIIISIVEAIKTNGKYKFFSPGAFGEIGGYPVVVDSSNDGVKAYIDEDIFTLDEMRTANWQSIEYDGIENIVGDKLIYTDDLLRKVYERFSVRLPKEVGFNEIEQTAEYIINKIIVPLIG